MRKPWTMMCVVLLVACKRPTADMASEAEGLRALVGRYGAASDAEREQLSQLLAQFHCSVQTVCAAKASCEKSWLSYRSATLSKQLASGLVATAHDGATRAMALAKLEEAATQFLEAKTGFEECVSAVGALGR